MDKPAPAEGVRLFVALDLPGEARAEIAAWQEAAVAGRNPLRPVREEGLHVTLVFLGRRPRELVERVWETAVASLAGRQAPTLTPAGAIWLPPRRPRVLALDLGDRDARATLVHESLSAALQRAGLHEPEMRPFRPHVTVARVRSRAKVRDLVLVPPPTNPFVAGQVTLYRSDLDPSGARYVALERMKLAVGRA